MVDKFMKNITDKLKPKQAVKDQKDEELSQYTKDTPEYYNDLLELANSKHFNSEINTERKSAITKQLKYAKANAEYKQLKLANEKLNQQMNKLSEENQITTNKCNELQAAVIGVNNDNAPLRKLYNEAMEKVNAQNKLLNEFEERFEAMHESHASLNQTIKQKDITIKEYDNYKAQVGMNNSIYNEKIKNQEEIISNLKRQHDSIIIEYQNKLDAVGSNSQSEINLLKATIKERDESIAILEKSNTALVKEINTKKTGIPRTESSIKLRANKDTQTMEGGPMTEGKEQEVGDEVVAKYISIIKQKEADNGMMIT